MFINKTLIKLTTLVTYFCSRATCYTPFLQRGTKSFNITSFASHRSPKRTRVPNKWIGTSLVAISHFRFSLFRGIGWVATLEFSEVNIWFFLEFMIHIPFLGIKYGSISRRDVYDPIRMHPFWIRPYAPESTGSRPISEVKLVTAQSVLWWGTTREYCVLYSFDFFPDDVWCQWASPGHCVPGQPDQWLW